jgi:hypothetical protein
VFDVAPVGILCFVISSDGVVVAGDIVESFATSDLVTG